MNQHAGYSIAVIADGRHGRRILRTYQSDAAGNWVAQPTPGSSRHFGKLVDWTFDSLAVGEHLSPELRPEFDDALDQLLFEAFGDNLAYTSDEFLKEVDRLSQQHPAPGGLRTGHVDQTVQAMDALARGDYPLGRAGRVPPKVLHAIFDALCKRDAHDVNITDIKRVVYKHSSRIEAVDTIADPAARENAAKQLDAAIASIVLPS
jgi:hypothetical protein